VKIIHREKRKQHFGDLNHYARLRKASRIAGGTSRDFDAGYDQINWKSKKGGKLV